MEVCFAKESHYRPLAEVSPVVKTLALHQFDDYVKRVRVFLSPRARAALSDRINIIDPLRRAIDTIDG
jgi:hypothetical protein